MAVKEHPEKTEKLLELDTLRFGEFSKIRGYGHVPGEKVG